MKVQVIAEEIWQDIAEDSTVSPTLISFWVREHIGELNVKINTDYIIEPTSAEISPELGENEKSILKSIYFVYYYGRKAQEALSLANTNSVVEISEGGGTVRLLNKNEMAKTYHSLKKDAIEDLNKMIALYRSNNAVPTQVTGTDTVEGIYEGNENTRLN